MGVLVGRTTAAIGVFGGAGATTVGVAGIGVGVFVGVSVGAIMTTGAMGGPVSSPNRVNASPMPVMPSCDAAYHDIEEHNY